MRIPFYNGCENHITVLSSIKPLRILEYKKTQSPDRMHQEVRIVESQFLESITQTLKN